MLCALPTVLHRPSPVMHARRSQSLVNAGRLNVLTGVTELQFVHLESPLQFNNVLNGNDCSLAVLLLFTTN